MLDRAGGMNELAAMHDQLVALTTIRPRDKIIPTDSGQLEQTYPRPLNTLD